MSDGGFEWSSQHLILWGVAVVKFEERETRFWELLREGASFTAACQAVGVDRRRGYRWRRARSLESITGRRRPPSGRYLSLDERMEIADLHRQGDGVRKIAAAVGRSPSTISRELSRNGVPTGDGHHRYAPYRAQRSAERRARRPKPFKLADPVLATVVAQKLRLRWSPEQISQHLRFDPVLVAGRVGTVSHETIYKALFVQGRGQLRAELHQCLRSGRAWRRSNHAGGGARKVRISDMINISERPAEVDDPAVPGHWESQCCCQAEIAVGAVAGSLVMRVVAKHGPDDVDASTGLWVLAGRGLFIRSSSGCLNLGLSGRAVLLLFAAEAGGDGARERVSGR